MNVNVSVFYKLILSISLFLLVVSSSAQKEFEDVILLKTAEVLRGNITDSIPGESVTILLHDSLSRTVMRVDIVRILREPRRMTREEIEKEKVKKASSRNNSTYYQGIIGVGYGVTTDETNGNYFKINFINGLGIDNKGSFGFGTGVRFVPELDATVIPFFMDIRLAFTRKAVSPFIAGGIGTGYQMKQIYFGRPKEFSNTGMLGYGEVGVKFSQNNKSAFMITVGFESFNAVLRSYDNYFRPRNYTRQIRGYTLNLALAF